MVFRASIENVHGSTALILGELDAAPHSLAALRSVPGIGNGKLAEILRLPNDIITRAAHLPIEGSMAELPMMDFFGAEIPEGYRYASFRRVSPLSLRAGNYDRAVHSLWPIQYAPSTSDRITETCLNPTCGGRLTWRGAKSFAHCGLCGADQREFRTNIAPDFDLEPLAFMAALVDPNGDSQDFLNLVPDRFRGASRGLLFMLGVLASRMEHSLEQKRSTGRREGSGRKLCDGGLAVGGRALFNWDDFVDGVIQRERELGHPLKRSSKVLKELRQLKKAGPAGEELFSQVTAKFGDHFCSSHNYVEGSRTRRVSERWARAGDAARILKVDNRRVATLRKKGLLIPIETYGKRRKCDIYSLDDILEIRQAVDESLSLAELKSNFDMPSVVAEDLIRAGLFKVEANPAVRFLLRGPRVMRAEVDGLIERIKNKTTPLDGSGREWFPIMTALDWIGGRPKPWARFLSEILSSDEPVAYVSSGDRFDFRAMRIHESTVMRMFHVIEETPQTATTKCSPVTCSPDCYQSEVESGSFMMVD